MSTEASTSQPKNYVVDYATFVNMTKELVHKLKDLEVLADQVAALPKGTKLKINRGGVDIELGKKEIRKLRSEFAKDFTELNKYFAAAKKKVKATRTGSKNNGFSNPIVVSDRMRKFFADARLGPLDPDNFSSGPLNAALNLLINHGISSSAILTPLFCIYASINELQDSKNRQHLRADLRMRDYFGSTFAELQAKGDKVDKAGKLRPAPCADSFLYATFQSIIAADRVPEANWTPEQKHIVEHIKYKLDKPEVANTLTSKQINDAQIYKQALQKEQEAASEALKKYREKRLAAVKEERTKTKESKAAAKKATAV